MTAVVAVSIAIDAKITELNVIGDLEPHRLPMAGGVKHPG